MNRFFIFIAMNPAETYILDQNEPFRTILLGLQLIIETTLPSAKMLFKFNIPFYYLDGKQPFCYLNQSKNYVDLCFWHGTHLTKHVDKLVSENRKHMKSLRYFSPEEIDVDVVKDVLLEAFSMRDRKYYKE